MKKALTQTLPIFSLIVVLLSTPPGATSGEIFSKNWAHNAHEVIENKDYPDLSDGVKDIEWVGDDHGSYVTGGSDGYLKYWRRGSDTPIRVVDANGTASANTTARWLRKNDIDGVEVTNGDRVLTKTGTTIRVWTDSSTERLRRFSTLSSPVFELSPGDSLYATGEWSQGLSGYLPGLVPKLVVSGTWFFSQMIFQSLTGHVFPPYYAGVSLYETKTNKKELLLTGHSNDITDVAFFPDGRRFVTGSTDNSAIVWNRKTEEGVTLEGHRSGYFSSVKAVAVSSSGDTVVTAGNDGRVVFWTQRNGFWTEYQSDRFYRSYSTVVSLEFLSNGRFLLGGTTEGELLVWDSNDGGLINSTKAHGADITSFAVSSGTSFLTASDDGTVASWDFFEPKDVKLARGAIEDAGFQWTPRSFTRTIETKNYDVFEQFLKARVPVNVRTKNGNLPLMVAVKNNALKIERRLLEAGASPTESSYTGSNPLEYSVANGLDSELAVMVEHDTGLVKKTATGRNPLFVRAARKGKVNIIDILIDHGVDVDATDHRGKSALMVASEEGHLRIVEKLLDAGSRVDLQDDRKFTALSGAVWFGHPRVTKLLLRNGANPNSQDDEGRSAVHKAIQKGHRKIGWLLYQVGIDEKLKDDRGRSPRSMVRSRGYESYEEWMVKS